MLATALASNPIRPERTARKRHGSAVEFIDAHLRDPDLDPQAVATAVLMSRRSLYQLLRAYGDTPANLIRTRRLLRSRELLVDPSRPHRLTGDIATAVGFRSAAQFSRAFRSEFGESPREYRQRVLARPRTLALAVASPS